jgi:hypothetical protein
VLNEILNGFEVVDAKNTIGMNKSELREFFDRLHNLPGGAVLEIDRVQTIAFGNALRETMRELGIEELSTRTGYDFDDAKQTLAELDRLVIST